MTNESESADAPAAPVLRVDAERCVGIGQCEMLEPDVFQIGDDGYAVAAESQDLTAERATAIIEACPSGAITAAN